MALAPFCTQPEEALHVRDIARRLGVGHPTARLWLAQLERDGVLAKSEKGRLTLYRLAMQHPLLVDYLVLAEKFRLLAACEKHPLLQEARTLFSKHNGLAVVFGSASEDFRKSRDIDIFCTGQPPATLIKKFAQTFGKEIHCIAVSSLDEVSEALRTEIIRKHLLLEGSEQLIRWMVWQHSIGADGSRTASSSSSRTQTSRASTSKVQRKR